jgi:BirA family biotin operon repressor/biotin-[acetyl-CoA-carboxylase] ligase
MTETLTTAPAFVLEHFPSIDSTNSELQRRAQRSSIHGIAVSADVQTAGRGQRGRRWFAEAGDALLLSVGWVFPPQTRLDGLSLAVGVTLARAVSSFAPDRVTLKWPNDVLMDDRKKLAGVLVETVSTSNGSRTAIIGIGVNIRPPHSGQAERFEPDALAAASLISNVLPRHADGAAIVCAALRETLLTELAQALPRFGTNGFAAFRDEWMARQAFANQPVRVIDASLSSGASYVGRIVDVRDDGALVIDDGRALHTLHSAAVSLRPA